MFISDILHKLPPIFPAHKENLTYPLIFHHQLVNSTLKGSEFLCSGNLKSKGQTYLQHT